jgi:peptidoglycan L-alanyl-D-glutamate endopeptidase CwlK
MSGEPKLSGVHPDLVAKVLTLNRVLSALGHPMMVTDGVRTTQQQQLLYAQGRTVPGKIVTQADGVVHRSNHQLHDDGLGHAVDMTFLVNGLPSWDEHLPWLAYGACAMALGLTWGGTWTKPDRPHIELA